MKRKTLLVRTVTIVVSLLLIAPSSVSADHGYGYSLRTRDNNEQDYEGINLTRAGSIACNHGADELDRSEISVRSGSNDIHCVDGNYTNPWVGLTECYDVNWWNFRCDHFRIYFNHSGFNQNPYTYVETNFWQSIGCHEFGHTGGLKHVSLTYSSCMWAAAWPNGEMVTSFDQNDLDDIDDDL